MAAKTDIRTKLKNGVAVILTGAMTMPGFGVAPLAYAQDAQGAQDAAAAAPTGGATAVAGQAESATSVATGSAAPTASSDSASLASSIPDDLTDATAVTAWAYDALSQEGEGAASTSTVDIAEAWERGGLVLSATGLYTLSRDVSASDTLRVEAPDDGLIVIDLNGHSASVKGDASLDAAIDIAGSKGTVVLVDTAAYDAEREAAEQGADAQARYLEDKKTPSAKIALETSAKSSAAVAVEADAPVPANEADDPVAPALIIADVALEVAGAGGVQADTDAAAIRTQSENVVLSGGFSTNYGNVASATDLASTKADAFVLEAGFATDEAMTAQVEGETDGTLIGHADLEAVARAAREAGQSESAATASANEAFSQIEIDAKGGTYTYRDGSYVYAPLGFATSESRLSASASASDSGDLNALWESASANNQLVLTEGGTYNLTADLEVKGALVIDVDTYATNRDVVINLNGHTLTVVEANTATGNSEGSALRATSAGAVTLNGGGGHIIFKGISLTHAISSESVNSFTMRDVSVAASTREDYRLLSGLGAIGLQANQGAVSLSNVSLCLDLSNQGFSSSMVYGAAPTGIVLGSSVSSATLSGCTVEIIHSNTACVASLSDPTASGWARAIDSKSAGQTTITGCTISAWAPLGGAIGVLGKNVQFTGDKTTINARASRYSVGVYADSSATGITLNAPLEVNHLGLTSSTETAGLFEASENLYSFGSSFDASALRVREGAGAYSANTSDTVFASFASGVSTATEQRIAAMLEDAVHDEDEGEIAVEGDAIVFKSHIAPATVTHEGTATDYASVEAAVSALKDGDTLTLNKDAGDLTLGSTTKSGMFGAAGETYTIDLAGHTAGRIVSNARADIAITSTGEGGAVSVTSGEGAIVQQGTGTLTVKNVAVTSAVTSGNSYGIFVNRATSNADGSGALVVEDVDIAVAAADKSVYGINQDTGAGGNVTVKGGSVTVTAGNTGTTTCGIKAKASNSVLTIEDCPISVQGYQGTTHGIEIYGTLIANGVADACDLAVTASATGANANVAGVYAAAAKANATLIGYSIAVSSAESSAQNYWCLANNSSITPSRTVFTLDGECGFSSSTDTHIRVKGSLALEAPLGIGAAFSLGKTCGDSAASAGRLTVLSSDLAGTNLATCPSGNASAANLFEATSDSIYAGCGLVYGDGLLAWSQDEVVRNERTGEAYVSLAAAIAAAEAGDTLALVGDGSVYESVSVDRALTIDLAGHTLTVHGKKAKASLVCSSDLVVCDTSAGNAGELALCVGTSESAAATYVGVEVASGSLFLDDARMSVTYEGTCVSQYAITLYGVSAQGGSVSLAGASELAVSSAKDATGFGALTSVGIYAGQACSAIDVSAASRVTVDNITHNDPTGSLAYPDAENPTSNTNSSTVANLLEIHPSEDSELYQLVQSAFRVSAQYDSAIDEEGKEYGTNLYYASGLVLDNGLRVWAYSDPVDPDDAGTMDTIVATHIFVNSTYDAPAESYGISAADEFAGSVSVAGTVEASSEAAGYAFALYENGADASWTSTGASLDATVDEATFTRHVGNFDLRSYTDLSSFTEPIIYPKNNTNFADLARSMSYAAPMGNADESYVRDIADWDKDSSAYDFLYAPAQTDVTLTFSNLRDASGTQAPAQTAVVTYGSTIAASGASVPEPSDYTIGDVTYRFIGWKVQGSSLVQNYCYSSDYLQSSFVFKQTVTTNAAEGAVALTAVYVPVKSGQHLITFRVDYAVAAVGVDDGDVPLFSRAYGDDQVGGPSKLATYSGYSTPFVGWSDDASNTADIRSESDRVITGLLPEATGDATYVAKFDKVLTRASVVFHCYSAADSSAGWGYEYLKDYDWTTPLLEAAAADPTCNIPAVGDVALINNTTYTCLGWSPRESDKEPLYTTFIPVEPSSSSNFSTSKSFYEVFSSSASVTTVTFYNTDGSVYSTVPDASYTATLASILPAAPTREGYTFKGWNTNPDATLALGETTNRLSALVGDDGAVALYPVWRQDASSDEGGAAQETTCAITFCDTDGTVLDYYENLVPGTTLWANIHEDPNTPQGEKGDLFLGWVDESGAEFSVRDTKIWTSLKVYASYRETVDTSDTSGKIDASSILSGGGTISATRVSSSQASSSSGSTASSAQSTSSSSKISAVESSVENAGYADSDSQEADEGSEESPTQTTGVVGAVALVLLLAVGAIALFRWFLGRHKGEDDAEEELEAELNANESIRF